VSTIHHGGSCGGELRTHRYRCYPPSDRSYGRCISLTWCAICREYSGAMTHVPRTEDLPDPLAALPPAERERLYRGEVRLLDHLDRIARRGLWPG
jgi:hypothetical protein